MIYSAVNVPVLIRFQAGSPVLESDAATGSATRSRRDVRRRSSA